MIQSIVAGFFMRGAVGWGMDDLGTNREVGGDLSKVQQPHWFRFSLKALLAFVVLLSVAILAFQYGYQMGRTVKVLELIDEGWLPPKP